MNGSYAAARDGARPVQDDDYALLDDLLVTPARPWATAVKVRPVGARCRMTPGWPTARRPSGRTLVAVASVLLAGGIVAAGVGASQAPVATAATPKLTAPALTALAVPHVAGRGALSAMRLAPAGDEALLARLMAAQPAPRAARQADQALLAALLASEPPAVAPAAPAAAVSFATVARLPASAFSYSAAAQQLPMIALADNVIPPPPPPPAPVEAAQQPPPPPGYVQPPGYQDGVPFGGQIGAVPRPATTRPATTRPAATRPAVVPGVYVVRAGDTLTAIALRVYGDARYAPRIWEANYRLIGANPNAIYPGQRLTLPGLTVQPAAPLPARGPIAQRSRYTIQPRDYLRWMAQRAYGNEVLWPEIYNANRNVLGPNPDLIYPGVTVYIP